MGEKMKKLSLILQVIGVILIASAVGLAVFNYAAKPVFHTLQEQDKPGEFCQVTTDLSKSLMLNRLGGLTETEVKNKFINNNLPSNVKSLLETMIHATFEYEITKDHETTIKDFSNMMLDICLSPLPDKRLII